MKRQSDIIDVQYKGTRTPIYAGQVKFFQELFKQHLELLKFKEDALKAEMANLQRMQEAKIELLSQDGT